jgi:hypothetical protein
MGGLAYPINLWQNKQGKEKRKRSWHWWLTPIILATQEAEIRRITVQSQPRQIIPETLSQKRDWWSGSSGRGTAE